MPATPRGSWEGVHSSSPEFPGHVDSASPGPTREGRTVECRSWEEPPKVPSDDLVFVILREGAPPTACRSAVVPPTDRFCAGLGCSQPCLKSSPCPVPPLL